MTDRVFQALDVTFSLDAPWRARRRLGSVLADLRSVDQATSTLSVLSVDQATSTLSVRRAGRFGRHWRAGFDGGVLVSGVPWWQAVGEGFVAVNAAAAASRGPYDIVLHAGAVAIGDVAVAFAGPSGAGKSTLTAACVHRGFGFLAEEVCAIDPETLVVRPYRRPIGVRRDGEAAKPSRVGARRGDRPRLAGPCVLGLVVLIERRPGPVESEVLRPALALLELSDTTAGAAGHETEMFWRLDALVRHVPVVVLRYDDATAAVGEVEMLVRRIGTA